jgi:hypothetical protein
MANLGSYTVWECILSGEISENLFKTWRRRRRNPEIIEIGVFFFRTSLVGRFP